MILRFSNHLFYRIYWWNVHIVKEKDLPLLSALLGTSIFHILNFSAVIFAFYTFVLKDVQLYPKWLHILFMFLILTIDYFLFVHNGRYKKVISKNVVSDKKFQKLDFVIILYLIFTFAVLVFTMIKGKELQN